VWLGVIVDHIENYIVATLDRRYWPGPGLELAIVETVQVSDNCKGTSRTGHACAGRWRRSEYYRKDSSCGEESDYDCYDNDLVRSQYPCLIDYVVETLLPYEWEDI